MLMDLLLYFALQPQLGDRHSLLCITDVSGSILVLQTTILAEVYVAVLSPARKTPI
jgi:hypothetical protein